MPSPHAMLAKDLEDDVDEALCKEVRLVFLPALNVMPAPLRQVIAVWRVKCGGYGFKFEKPLVRSLKATSLPVSARKCEGAVESEGEGYNSPPKHQRIAKGKVKLVRYDWSEAKFQRGSENEDHNFWS